MGRLRFWMRRYLIRENPGDPSPPPFYRADQSVICSVCGWDYWHHPQYPLFPFLVIICNGELVKL